MTVAIRRAHPDDLVTIASWEKDLFGSDAWSTRVVADELAHPDSYYLVAEQEGELVGYAGLRAAERGSTQGDIQTIAVIPTHRRHGVGRELLRQLLAEAQRRGVHDVFLEVRADNPAAVELYLSEDFREITRRRGYYQPDGVDAIVMSCRLTEHPRGGQLA